MKKNKAMRLASALLVLTLLTTCAISSTFAKYVTKAEGTATARVAKWGFTQAATIELDDLFKNAYSNDDGVETVKSAVDEVDVIAPGTTNSATFGFTYGGETGITAPEVAYTFEISTTGSTCDDPIKNNTNIQWSLDGVLAKADGKTDGSWDALLAAIEALDGNKTDNKYEPNTLPEAFKNANANEHTVSWQWVFETTTGEGQPATQDDTDTEMGNATDLADVTLKITVAATQVD